MVSCGLLACWLSLLIWAKRSLLTLWVSKVRKNDLPSPLHGYTERAISCVFRISCFAMFIVMSFFRFVLEGCTAPNSLNRLSD